MPPTRREQLELDELLSDIYLGIESLPDRSAPNSTASNTTNHYNHQHSYQQNQSLKNSSGGGDLSKQHQEPQSLASIVTSTNRRRVRIVEPSDKRVKEEQQVVSGSKVGGGKNLVGTSATTTNSLKPAPVKYVNTYKLIYHQEKNPDDIGGNNNNNNYDDDDNQVYGSYNRNVDSNYREHSYYNQDHHLVTTGKNYDSDEDEKETAVDDDDEFDGKTRVEYYHTSWLDRQLGRLASRRRSSKELTERQIKEKAMIEELKRNLKNGSITLRHSLKGNKKNNNKLDSYDLDEYLLERENESRRKSPLSSNKEKNSKFSSVTGSGLATLPRSRNTQQQRHYTSTSTETKTSTVIDSNNYKSSSNNQQPVKTEPKVTSSSNSMQTRQQELNYSRTLPHRRNEHQLLQSHYKGANSVYANPTTNGTTNSLARPTGTRNYNSNTINVTRTNYPGSRSPATQYQQPQQQQQQVPQMGATISSMPSATEVVRSALSRSGSTTSVNQLNRTINLLPTSPSPCLPNSPMTPTQQLRATSPSPVSPSPVSGQHYHQHQHQVQQHQPYQRPIQQQQQQPVYANPHASLMQQRADEQARRHNTNHASIREFNELDSLLRSLSPASTTVTTTRVTAGYDSRPAPASFGYGFTSPAQPAQPQQQVQQPQPQYQAQSATGTRLTGQRVVQPAQDLYAKVQKQPFSAAHANNEQTKASYLQQNYLTQNMTGGRDEFTIDVTNKKLDENCIQQRAQNLSEFEPPIELLPSMEDYQNITKLNPVKNHYWYKPHMSRDRAIELLKDKPQGTFIVRDSTSFQGAFGLAVKVSKLPKNVLNNASLRNPNDPSAELIRHFLIEPTPGGVRLKGYANEPIFGSLPALIYQHSLVELALPCRLVIPRADIEDKNFNLKQKQFYDEFIASKEIAKHMPYEITSPDGGYRRYPGDVYVHNEHRIIYE